MNTKDTIHSQLEHLQLKYVGTGHADTNKFEWGVNIHRDTYASIIGHHNMLQYNALATNQNNGRVRFNLLQKMLSPVGPPPAGDDSDSDSD